MISKSVDSAPSFSCQSNIILVRTIDTSIIEEIVLPHVFPVFSLHILSQLSFFPVSCLPSDYLFTCSGTSFDFLEVFLSCLISSSSWWCNHEIVKTSQPGPAVASFAKVSVTEGEIDVAETSRNMDSESTESRSTLGNRALPHLGVLIRTINCITSNFVYIPCTCFSKSDGDILDQIDNIIWNRFYVCDAYAIGIVLANGSTPALFY